MKLFHLTLLHNSSLLDGLITTEHTEITEKRKKDLKFPSVISVVNLIYATTPFYFVFCAVILPLSGFTDAPRKEENCPDGKQHYRATLRHIEKGGIGYEDGYTTLEAFLSSDPSQWRVTPFLDVRGHLSDSGKWAANAGTGLRFLWKNRAYGVNTYYDYRNTDHFNSHQIGAGLETLGELFDFRINGYLPIAAKTSAPYDAIFGAFSGHYMLVSQKVQSAMKGADAEFGFHFGKSASFDFYAAAGPYYFSGEMAPATWGGKGKISGTFKDILTLELSDSYDRTFHNNFQGQISLSFSFGPKSKVKAQGRTCQVANILSDRMVQPVGRQEIIVIDTPRKNSVAIDPATGLPYFFVFVDNTSSSSGTYESPYPTLLQAQNNSSPNDIIYVFPGDGTTKGMNSGIFLKANQKFWGSGVSHLIQTSDGAITIPAQSSSSPTITNSNLDTDGNAITLATHNAISGFHITNTLNDAIYGADPQSLDVSFCTIENTHLFTIQASFSASASVSVTNNQFLNNDNGVSLTLNGTSTIDCLNNTFKGQSSTSETPLEISASNNTFAAQIENNVFDANKTGTIQINLTNVVNADVTLLNNTITNNDTGAIDPGLASGLAISPSGTTAFCSILAKGNTFSGNKGDSLYIASSGAITTLEITASHNTMSNNERSALVVATSVDTLTLIATDNRISNINDNGIALTDSALTSSGNITINNNTITDIGNTQSGISIAKGSPKMNLTILNNDIARCEGSGILSYSDGIDSFTVNISGNTISDCQNVGPSNAASGLDIEQYIHLAASVTNNTFSGNTNPAVGIGSTLSTPTACLTLSGNNSSTDYALKNPMDGLFNLSPCNVDSVNVGTITTTGTITSVQSCPAATPCPP